MKQYNINTSLGIVVHAFVNAGGQDGNFGTRRRGNADKEEEWGYGYGPEQAMGRLVGLDGSGCRCGCGCGGNANGECNEDARSADVVRPPKS
mmetsp:Transcript_32000/g.68168  ORF Transcript_32000/g.68168 Transcript_32000/m.68168 type:complete len:92 (+) Transcript_32000:41-316(+)